MKPRYLLKIAIALVLTMPFAGTPREAKGEWAPPENPLEGREAFSSKHCIKCHSIQGVGGRTGPDLGDISLGSFMDIASSLWNHFPRMIEAFRKDKLEWPKLTVEESEKLFTFLYFLNYFDKASNAEIGERLYHIKSCIRCHSVGGKGGDSGPELDEFQTKYAVPYITSALWNSGPEMLKEMREEKIPQPQFQERDVIDILAFIRNKGLSEETTRSYLPPANPVKGKKLFKEKKCINCHVTRGRGEEIGPDLAKKKLKGSLSHILSQMWNHGSNMWPKMKKKNIEFPEFTPEEMSDLMAYLYFLQFNEAPGSAKRGSKVFSDKKCRSCHIPGDTGGRAIGPNLAEAGLDSPFKIIAEMWNHAPAIHKKMKEANIRWPLLETGEMRDMVQYILSLDKNRQSRQK